MSETNYSDTYDNYTPLHAAAAANAVDDAKLLLANGADVNAEAASKSVGIHYTFTEDNTVPGPTFSPLTVTPLQEAARTNAFEVAKLLVENGADMNAADISDPALVLAIRKNAVNIVELLLENGVDTACCPFPLHLAVTSNAVDVVKLLLGNVLLKHGVKAKAVTNLLFSAVKTNAVDAAKLLLKNGVDVNAISRGIGTPLHVAAANNALDIAELLLTYNADVNAKGCNPTPLYFAAACCAVDVAHLLITNGADVNAKSDFDHTPLHAAVQSNAVDIAKLLLANGADLHAKCGNERTALSYAKWGEGWYGFGAKIMHRLSGRRRKMIALLKKHGRSKMWRWIRG